MASEALALQERLDQQAISQALVELEHHANDFNNSTWATNLRAATGRLQNVYNEYVPDMDQENVRLASIIGGSLLSFIAEKYGPSPMQPKLYSGAHEKNAIATYHNLQHTEFVVTDMIRYGAWKNQQHPGTYTPEDFFLFSIIGGAHDMIIENGRGNDERQCGKLAQQIAMQFGISLAPDPRLSIPIEAGTWNHSKNKQSFDPSKGYVLGQMAKCSADILSPCKVDGPLQSVYLEPEDMSKRFTGGLLAKEAEAAGVSLEGASIEDCMALVDERQALTNVGKDFWNNQISFYTDYPDKAVDPEIDKFETWRHSNIPLVEGISADYNAGRVTAVGILERCRDIAAR